MTDGDKLKTRVTSVLEDPSAKAVARVYARSFLDAADAADAQALLDEFASFVEDVLDTQPEFAALLQSRIVTRDQKIGIIDRAIRPAASELFTSFLRVLAKHDRLELLPLILSEARREHETRTGKARVVLRSATPLTVGTLETIQQRLDAAFPFEPIIETETDSSLLGGLVIQVGNTVYDSSLRTRLKQLRERLRERSRYEIQSGRNRFSHPEGD